MQIDYFRVFLVGDNKATRKELSQMLDREEGITVVGAAGSGEQALAAAKKLPPGVALMLTDIRMSGVNVIDTAYAIAEAQLPAKVIISTEDFSWYPVPVIKAGVADLLSRDTSLNQLVRLYVKYTCGPLAHSRPSDSLARPGYHAVKWLSGGVAM